MDDPLAIAPAPGETRWLALALVNTELEPRGRPMDLLDDASATATWLASRGLIDQTAAVNDADAQRLRALRAAMRDVFQAAGNGEPPAADALAALNAASAAAPGMRQLAWRTDQIVGPWRPAPGPGSMDIALATIANDATDLLLGDDGARLRTCDAHGCVRMFVQEHARRRWCSRTCGDRVRVARHYEKTHPGRTSS